MSYPKRFLSTPSGWRATRVGFFYPRRTLISIHALRVEGDHCDNSLPAARRDFYPRPPGGGRHEGSENEQIEYLFLSTPSGWRATKRLTEWREAEKFLSTPSGWRATFMILSKSGFFCDFYPRPPGGGRPLLLICAATRSHISIHALRVEGDYNKFDFHAPSSISIHALRVEGDGWPLRCTARR